MGTILSQSLSYCSSLPRIVGVDEVVLVLTSHKFVLPRYALLSQTEYY